MSLICFLNSNVKCRAPQTPPPTPRPRPYVTIGGASFPVINVAFGELLDSTASLSNVEETTKNAVLFMIGVACVLGVSLFLGFGLVRGVSKQIKSSLSCRLYLCIMFARDSRRLNCAIRAHIQHTRGSSSHSSYIGGGGGGGGGDEKIW